jgi:hypothetical protein
MRVIHKADSLLRTHIFVNRVDLLTNANLSRLSNI